MYVSVSREKKKEFSRKKNDALRKKRKKMFTEISPVLLEQNIYIFISLNIYRLLD